MALSPIRPKDLPAAATVYASDAIPVDNGSAVQRATSVQIVNAGRPVSTQAEVLAGTRNDVAITPLTLQQKLDSVVDVGDIIRGTFNITSPSGGRGPYSMLVSPGNENGIDLEVNGLAQSPLPENPQYVIISMPSSPSGVGVLFSNDQPVGARVDYKISVPLTYNPALDNSLDYPSLAALNAAIAGGMTRAAGRMVSAGGRAFVSEPGAVVAGLPSGFIPAGSSRYDSARGNISETAANTQLLVLGTGEQYRRMTLMTGAGAYDVNVDFDLTGLTAAHNGVYFDFFIHVVGAAASDRRLIFRNGSGGVVIGGPIANVAATKYGARVVFNGTALAWQLAWINQSVFI